MTRSAVAQLFRVVPKRFRRNAFAVSDEDFFVELRFFVEYDVRPARRSHGRARRTKTSMTVAASSREHSD